MVMLNQRILLPQYKNSPPKAQTTAFQKVLDRHVTGNTITRHSTLDTRHSTLDTRHSTSLTSFHQKNSVNSIFISSLIHKNAQLGFFTHLCVFSYMDGLSAPFGGSCPKYLFKRSTKS